MTSSGCLSRGSRGRVCLLLCVTNVSLEDLCIIIGVGLHERRARDILRSWGLRGLGEAVWV